MLLSFYVSAGVAIAATALMITGSMSCTRCCTWSSRCWPSAIVLFILGAPFVAPGSHHLRGAIMVLFVFVIMMLNLGRRAIRREHAC